MSSIKLSPNASGTAIFTIEAPATSTNRTLTLPDQTGTVLTNAGPFTANASASNGAVTIDASNNVGIGTSSPGYTSAGRTVLQVNGSSTSLIGLAYGGTNAGYLFATSTDTTLWSEGSRTLTIGTAAGGPLVLTTNNAERARIDTSGNLLVGTTSQPSASVVGIALNNNVASNASSWSCGSKTTANTMIQFINGNGQVGNIQTSGSATTYATSSDYRLKENVQPMTGALAKVQSLKPVTYKWKVDGSDGEGFIAHELAEVVPQCVSGEKDAVDADGNPVYQGIDTSFLVATLTAAIQELKAELDSVKAELAVLKGV